MSTTSAAASSENLTVDDKDAPFSPHFVVVSLGNPAPYENTYHSAGHIALQSLQSLLQRDAAQPKFSSERLGKKSTQTSRGPRYTLLQCPTLMNVSGTWLSKAWREALEQHRGRYPDTPLGLVVVHDDLEEDHHVVKIRPWQRSHRGHNGLKSIMTTMPAPPSGNVQTDPKWAKISLGVGRPANRDPETVADYVLRPLSKFQRESLSEKSGPSLLAALEDVEAAWRSERESGLTTTSSTPAQKGRTKSRR
ncbi:peptidyl-tRNA hydrolase [Coniella lustricola]|uniref:peptidyl-tRNA hydrolase n=1 Tax=Coniella lustricola TaxID=2025994 RepID=A0A2T3A2P5_9PEZI|nr:peptidyl-tRNA hydrolase [Coniella lustricola]